MTLSPPDRVRLGLALLVAADVVLLAALTLPRQVDHPEWLATLTPLARFAGSAPALAVLAFIGLAGALAFARDRSRLAPLWPLLTLGAVFALDQAYAATHGTYGDRFYFGATALTGWWLGGLAAGPRAAKAARDALSMRMALAGTAALHVTMAVTRLTATSAVWLDPAELQLAIASRLAVGHPLREPIQQALLGSEALTALFAGVVVASELAAIGLMAGPRLRLTAATFAAFGHLATLLVVGVFWGSALVLLALFAWPSRRAVDPTPAAYDALQWPRLAATAGLVAAFVAGSAIAGGPVVDPNAAVEDGDGGTRDWAGWQPTVGSRVLESYGPLRAGAPLVRGFTVVGLEARAATAGTPRHTRIRVARPPAAGGAPGEATLRLRPMAVAPAEPMPFDRAGWRLEHGHYDVPDDDVEAVLEHVAAELERALDGQDAMAADAAWLGSALEVVAPGPEAAP